MSPENEILGVQGKQNSRFTLLDGDDAYGALPIQMREAKRWVNHRADKVPCDANGIAIDATNPANFLSFETALAISHASGGGLGLGFALGPDETGKHWQGIDLDDVEVNELADLADSLPGYVEQSPSGKGVHAIGYGAGFPALGSNGTGIEAYSERRYFTVTGKAIRDAS